MFEMLISCKFNFKGKEEHGTHQNFHCGKGIFINALNRAVLSSSAQKKNIGLTYIFDLEK